MFTTPDSEITSDVTTTVLTEIKNIASASITWNQTEKTKKKILSDTICLMLFIIFPGK